jgi:hypothetical protein
VATWPCGLLTLWSPDLVVSWPCGLLTLGSPDLMVPDIVVRRPSGGSPGLLGSLHVCAVYSPFSSQSWWFPGLLILWPCIFLPCDPCPCGYLSLWFPVFVVPCPCDSVLLWYVPAHVASCLYGFLMIPWPCCPPTLPCSYGSLSFVVPAHVASDHVASCPYGFLSMWLPDLSVWFPVHSSLFTWFPCPCGSLSMWFPVHVVPCPCGSLSMWFPGNVVHWSCGSLVMWFPGHVVPCPCMWFPILVLPRRSYTPYANWSLPLWFPGYVAFLVVLCARRFLSMWLPVQYIWFSFLLPVLWLPALLVHYLFKGIVSRKFAILLLVSLES